MISYRAKAVICYGLLILFGLLTVVSFSIPFVTAAIEGQKISINGFDYLSVKLSDEGMSDEMTEIGLSAIKMMQAFTVCAIVFGSLMLLTGIMGLCMYLAMPARVNILTHVAEIACAVGLALCAIFAIFYFIIAANMKSSLELIEIESDMNIKITMLGIIPIILWSILGLAYVLLLAFTRNAASRAFAGGVRFDISARRTDERSVPVLAATASVDVDSEKKRMESLRTYRRLVEDGVISDEEFLAHKKFILGS